jgi:hypothetical protein
MSEPSGPDQICLNCRLWDWEPGEATGRCRYYPPVVIWDYSKGIKKTVWPVTHEYDWCGRWQWCGTNTRESSDGVEGEEDLTTDSDELVT